jgi:hypothetical protein
LLLGQERPKLRCSAGLDEGVQRVGLKGVQQAVLERLGFRDQRSTYFLVLASWTKVVDVTVHRVLRLSF